MKQQSGLTMIELLITLAAFGILVSLAVPGFNSFTRNNRLVTETNALVGSIFLARSEATKRSTNVSVCKSTNGLTCANGGLPWSRGWIVFVNTDNDDPAQVDDGELILRVNGPITVTNTLQASAALTNFITYRPNGTSNVQGQFILCNDTGAPSARAISVSRVGRPNVSKGGGICTPV